MCKELFDEINVCGSGELAPDEVRVLTFRLFKRDPTEIEWEFLMEEMDPDGDGIVTYTEFSDWYHDLSIQSRLSIKNAGKPAPTSSKPEPKAAPTDEFLAGVASPRSELTDRDISNEKFGADGELRMMGVLEKFCEGGMLTKKWQTRWFELLDDKLSYSSGQGKRSKGLLDMAEVQIAASDKKDHCIEIALSTNASHKQTSSFASPRVKEGRTNLLVAAFEAEEYKKWFAILTQAHNRAVIRRVVRRFTSKTLLISFETWLGHVEERKEKEEAEAAEKMAKQIAEGEVGLPAGFSIDVSRSTGEIYYINLLTNISQFDRPTEEAKAPAPVPILPPGWKQEVSRTTGETYYVNLATNETQFEVPTVGATHCDCASPCWS